MTHAIERIRPNLLRDEMDRLFTEFFGESLGRPAWRGFDRDVYPTLNVWEDSQAFHAEADVPGVRMEDLEVSVKGDELTIRGERRGPEVKDGAWLHLERGEGSFCRVLRLPAEVDEKKIDATLQNGVLRITLLKAEQARPRRIEIRKAEK
jgi:HSP20 family protein